MLRAEVWTYLVVVSAAAMLYLEAIVDLLLLPLRREYDAFVLSALAFSIFCCLNMT